MFVRINCCPICSSEDFQFQSHAASNLYSEKIASELGISETELLENVYNVICKNCSLIFKNKWFTNTVLDSLFTQLVSSHPKGWDVVSNRFSLENFYIELDIFKKAIENRDIENINRYKRALISLLDSALSYSEQREHQDFFTAIQNENTEYFKTNIIRDFLIDKFNTPAPYKRFSGFSDIHLWDYIKSKIGVIRHYDEVGCPLWGLIGQAYKDGIETKFLKRVENNYWNSGCSQNGLHCTEKLKLIYPVEVGQWNNIDYEKRDLLGAFLYIDHLNDVNTFLNEIFSRYNNIAIILDIVDDDKSAAHIQHFSGFNSRVMEYLALRYGKKMHFDYNEIVSSGNNLFLFTSTN